MKPGINIFRYANRIPLLFEGGSDVITRTALKRVNWGSYKINQSSDKVGVFVSVVSTKIPFKGAGKEYMADDVEEIQNAVKTAIQNCCLQLKQKIVRQQAAREQKQRKRNLTKYIPNVAAAVQIVLESIAERDSGKPASKRICSGKDLSSILDKVRSGDITETTLQAKLEEHVERIDTDMVRLADGKMLEIYRSLTCMRLNVFVSKDSMIRSKVFIVCRPWNTRCNRA